MKKLIIMVALLAIFFSGTAYAGAGDISASADAYVWEKTKDTNYGGNSFFGNVLGTGKFLHNSVYSFLAFDLAAISNTQSAYLWLYGGSVMGSSDVTVWSTDTGWNENTITWNNMPDNFTQGATTAVNTAGRWYSWDVSSFVNAAEGSTLSLALTGNGNHLQIYGSSDIGCKAPYIRVTAAPEPISSALFLIGGTVLAVRQHRKRKKT